MDYKTAGVDIEAGYKSVELMKEHVKRTMREEVLGGLGGFSGAFSLAAWQRDVYSLRLPSLVARQRNIRDLCLRMSMIWLALQWEYVIKKK